MSDAKKRVWHSKELVKLEGKDLDRFWSYLTKEGPLPDQENPFYKGLGPCWQWIGPKFHTGYGCMAIRRTPRMTHRLSYAVEHGITPEDSVIMHKCDNILCVNPEHLELGDARKNVDDRDRKGRKATGDRSGSRTKPESLKRGEAHGMSKFTDAEVLEIRRRFDAKEVRVKDLVRETGVDRTALSRIVHRHAWKHLP